MVTGYDIIFRRAGDPGGGGTEKPSRKSWLGLRFYSKITLQSVGNHTFVFSGLFKSSSMASIKQSVINFLDGQSSFTARLPLCTKANLSFLLFLSCVGRYPFIYLYYILFVLFCQAFFKLKLLLHTLMPNYPFLQMLVHLFRLLFQIYRF